MVSGERVKILWNLTVVWAIDYGINGESMALSPDSTFLIAGTKFSTIGYIGKLNSADGDLLASYTYNSAGSY